MPLYDPTIERDAGMPLAPGERALTLAEIARRRTQTKGAPEST